MPLKVTRVTVEYVTDGKRFSIDFAVDGLGALVFNTEDLRAFNFGLANAKDPSAKSRPRPEFFFDPAQPLAAQELKDANGKALPRSELEASSTLVGASSLAVVDETVNIAGVPATRGLWKWNGSWVHPQ